MSHNESRLPKWAQEKLARQRADNDRLASKLHEAKEIIGGIEAELERKQETRRLADLDYRVLDAARGAITEAIIKKLVGFKSPLSEIVARVVGEHEAELYDLVNREMSTLLTAEDFKAALRAALNDKLARVLVARMGGELEKRVNELRSDPTARARITLAINTAIEEMGRGE